ncbi:MAG: tRNA pseudouridine(55) synthase TruB [Cellvibrionaceae bacterium]|nr:tRNA pseudouridine(55) synthase TruB [Cellvibrionaceae bacterium]
MGRRPKWGRSVDGVLLLNKAAGVTSNTALQQVKRLFHAKRAGHTGSLDPLATGVLPICLGESTKFSQYLLDADKRYRSRFRFGVTTDTGDSDGTVLSQQPVTGLCRQDIEQALLHFRGPIEQLPSMYSALKYQGKPLYQWAREGRVLPPEARQSRRVEVFSYTILNFYEGAYPEVEVEVHCTKGTYIRTLAEDLGQRLGVGAHVIALHRLAAGPFVIADSLSMAALTQARGEAQPEVLDCYLLALDAPLQALPKIEITNAMAGYFCRGEAVMSLQAYRLAEEGDKVRVYRSGEQFLGVGVLSEGNIAPKRLVSSCSH